MTRKLLSVLGTCVVVALGASAQQPPTAPPANPPTQSAQPQPAPQERVAAIKQSFMESQKKLRSYEWIENTVLTLKGEEKSDKMNRCYYGADGKVQKVPVGDSEEKKKPGGIRGKIIDKKKAELTEYMDNAGELVHQYMPPDPEKIQACKEAGKVFIQALEPEKSARIICRDYLVPNDSLSFDIDLKDNRILAVAVSSFLGKDKDPVSLDVTFDALPDGTIHAAKTVLDAKAKEIQVTITNSGYRNMTQ